MKYSLHTNSSLNHVQHQHLITSTIDDETEPIIQYTLQNVTNAHFIIGYNQVMKQLESMPIRMMMMSSHHLIQQQKNKNIEKAFRQAQEDFYIVVFVLNDDDTNSNRQLLPFLSAACALKKIPIQMLSAKMMNQLCEEHCRATGGKLVAHTRFLMVRMKHNVNSLTVQQNFKPLLLDWLQRKLKPSDFSVYTPPVVLPVTKVPHTTVPQKSG